MAGVLAFGQGSANESILGQSYRSEISIGIPEETDLFIGGWIDLHSQYRIEQLGSNWEGTNIDQVKVAELTEPIVRSSCKEIVGTPYESVEERDWYRENCITNPPPAYFDVGDVQSQFVSGYIAGGGNLNLLPIVLCIIEKESGWNPYAVNQSGPFYGLGQFLMSTWNSVGGGDWTDPWTQGRNFARNWNQSDPAWQWPLAFILCA